jgi:predicted Zn-dependent peptidase
MTKKKKPSIMKGTMSNGMDILLVSTTSTQLVSVGMFIKVGTKYENKNNNGISHFLEHMMFQGTRKRTGIKIANDLDNVGANYNASTSYEFTFYDIQGQSKDLDLFLEIIIDIYYNSILNTTDIEREKEIVLEELRMYQDDPKTLLDDIFQNKMYKGTSFGMPILGPEENIRSFTKEDLLKFREDYYIDDNSCLVIIGNIDFKKLTIKLEKLFEKLSHDKDSKTIQQQFIITNQKRPYLYIKYDNNMKQTLVKISFKTLGRNNPYSNVLHLIEEILSNGSSSRLFVLLRNKLAVTYFNTVSYDQFKDIGTFTITMGIDPKRVPQVIKAVLNEIEKLKTKKILKKELNKIEKIRETNEIIRNETSILESLYNYGIDELFNDEINYQIDDVQPIDMMNICKEVFIPENLNVFIMGDFNQKNQVINIIDDFS